MAFPAFYYLHGGRMKIRSNYVEKQHQRLIHAVLRLSARGVEGDFEDVKPTHFQIPTKVVHIITYQAI